VKGMGRRRHIFVITPLTRLFYKVETQQLTITRLSEYDILSPTNVVLLTQNAQKIVGGRGSALNPTGEAHDASQNP
jgi:hypothetical protein